MAKKLLNAIFKDEYLTNATGRKNTKKIWEIRSQICATILNFGLSAN
jgi:hypothetical protein